MKPVVLDFSLQTLQTATAVKLQNTTRGIRCALSTVRVDMVQARKQRINLMLRGIAAFPHTTGLHKQSRWTQPSCRPSFHAHQNKTIKSISTVVLSLHLSALSHTRYTSVLVLVFFNTPGGLTVACDKVTGGTLFLPTLRPPRVLTYTSRSASTAKHSSDFTSSAT
jgi:hypothetical protein